MATTGTPTSGDDTLTSDGDGDQIAGLQGNDSISGGGGNDTIFGDVQYLVNFNFSSNQGDNSWSAGSVDGWFNTGSGGTIERWGTGFLGFTSPDGGQVIELDGNTTGRDHIQTNVDLETGVTYEISIDHAARSGPGVNDDFQITLNGTVVATISPSSTTYFTTSTITVTGAAGIDTIGIRELNSQDNSQGVIIDSIQISQTQTAVDGSAFTFDDTLDGGTGDDMIFGQEGEDVIIGGDGDDYLEGGIGDDVFVLEDGGDSDTVGDFVIGEDLLDVTGLTDAGGDPVGVKDVVVTSDGEAGSILTFPNGETVRLVGIPPEDLDTFAELNAVGIPCLASGVLVQTNKGDVLVEDLGPGDLVAAYGGQMVPVLRTFERHVSGSMLRIFPKLRPVRITAGALGEGLPKRDLLVSRQHRMLVCSKIAKRMCASDVLIPAIKLTKLPGIFVDEAVTDVAYYHILFQRHEVIYAEGAPTESLYTGAEAMKSLQPEARAEILTLFPELQDADYTPVSAFPIPKQNIQNKMIQRHAKNRKMILQA